MNKEENIKYLIGALGVISLIIVLVLIVVGGPKANNSDTVNQISYSKEDVNRPITKLSINKIDWGNIKVSDTVESIVDLNNEGKSNLEITRMSTSCGCTSVKAIYPDGTETKEYSMHKTSEKVVVQPGTTVKLKIVYRPYTMPVEGAVTRQVFLTTNDPSSQNLEIVASAVVAK